MQQPPWRAMAEESLKARDPQRYKALRSAGKLDGFLDNLDSRLRTGYDRLVKDIQKSRGSVGTFALLAAEEILVRDVLVPETSP